MRLTTNGAGGFSFQFCEVPSTDELTRDGYAVPTYLGRPWHATFRVLFMQCMFSNFLHPRSHLYDECKCIGAEVDVSGRVWPGYHIIQDVL